MAIFTLVDVSFLLMFYKCNNNAQSIFTGDKDVEIERNDVLAVAFQSHVTLKPSDSESLPLVCEASNSSR